jgi:magnesium-transporting ATPase (P-type)
MQEPPKRREEAIINKYMWSQIIYASVFIGALSLLFLKLPMIQSTFEDCSRTYMMTAFFAFFMFINILNSLNCRTHDFNPLSYISLNKPFVLIMGIASIAQVLLIFFGGPIFRTVPISMYHFAVITVLALTVIPADILRKVFIRIKYGKNIINT